MAYPQRIPRRQSATSPLSGSLNRTPLAHLLVFLAQKEKSGTLSVQVGGQESLVLFEDGAPSKAHTPWTVPYLGVLVMRMGLLDPPTYDETRDEALRSGELHGKVLLDRGLVSEETLQEALREQTALRILEVFRHYDGASTFHFHENEDLLQGWGAGSSPVDPWRILWCGCALRPADPAARRTLSLLGDIPVTVRSDAALDRFGFGADERRALQWAQSHPSSVEGLSQAGLLSVDQMLTVLYVLFLTRCLAFHTSAAGTPAGTAQPQRGAYPRVPRSGTIPRVSVPSSMPPPMQDASTVQSPAEGHDTGPKSNRPSAEVGTSADAQEPLSRHAPRRDELRASLRRIYHASSSSPPAPESTAPPERSTPPPASSARPYSRAPGRSTFPAASSASPFGNPPSTPRQPDASSPAASVREANREPAPASRRDADDAMVLIRDARDARERGDLKRAEALARRALEAQPNDPPIRTELAWILALQPKRRRVGDLGEPLELAKQAMRQDPNLAGPYCVQGIVYQALGMHEQAFQAFRKAITVNRRCAEAAAEVKVYSRRYRETGSLEPRPESASSSGLGAVLTKFFKA